MDKNLVKMLAKDSILINIYTGNTYRFISQNADGKYVDALLSSEEKWNKYKMIYETEPEKRVKVDVSEIAPWDKIPFYNAKGKKLFDVRNMDIVSYKKGSEIIRTRVVLRENSADINNIRFTLVDEKGNDVSDTGSGYTAIQFAEKYNPKGRFIKRIAKEDGIFAEVDKRFNNVNNSIQLKSIRVPGRKSKVSKEEKPLKVYELHRRLRKLKFSYKDGYAQIRISPVFSKNKQFRMITEDYIRSIVNDYSFDKIERFRYLEAYNISKQIEMNEIMHGYQEELENVRRKTTIDVTEEEKVNSRQNIERLEKEIADCRNQIEALNSYRNSIINDYNSAIHPHGEDEKREAITEKTSFA